MANEAPIVETVQFAPTKECLTDPSLFQTVRDIVERWQDNGMQGQYWGSTVEKPINMHWFIFWQSRAHAAAFAADPLYTEFVHRRQSLATTPVRVLHVALSGTPQLWVKAPVTEIGIYKSQDTHIEKVTEMALVAAQQIVSLQPPGFLGGSFGVPDEDPGVGYYIAGWNSVEEFMRLGMEEAHKEHREAGEEMMKYLSDLHLTQIVFKSHSA